MPLAAGQVINQRYRIVRLLGQGGFGAVYQAHDLNLDRDCAFKENLETSDEVSRQFEREARLLANLSHPNLPRVTDHFRIPGQGQYLVMDFIDGEDLEQRLRRTGGPLPEAQVLHWIAQVCDALAYLHHHDPPVIHRDIKPANIRITPRNQAMLVDFGIAKEYNPTAMTTIGARAVTPGFSPPEQYGRGETDERSDIYALGATLYALLTGTNPPESVDLMAGNVAPLPPAHIANPAVSLRSSAAVVRALQPGKLQRHQTMLELKAALVGSGPAEGHPAAGQPAAGGLPQTLIVGPDGRPAGRPASGAPPGGGAAVYPAGERRPSGPPAGGGSGRLASQQVIPAPPSTPRRGAALAAVVVLGLGGLLLLVALGAVLAAWWLGLPVIGAPVIGASGTGAPASAAPVESAAPPFGGLAGLEPSPTALPASPAALDTPTPVNTAVPADWTPVSLPSARLAFVSDHTQAGVDRLYVVEVYAGEYWFNAKNQELISQDGLSRPAVSAPQALPVDSAHNVAWWPEWCDGDRTIVYEAQQLNQPNYQALYRVDAAGAGPAVELRWSGLQKLGVPKCPRSGSTVLMSALADKPNATWELYGFDLQDPAAQPTYFGFGFAGNAAWSGDGSYVILMQRAVGEQTFALARFDWADPTNLMKLLKPGGLVDQKYPAISPVTGELAFACSDGESWGLCRSDADGGRPRRFAVGIALKTGRPGGLAAPPVTPSWSPDGQWIAYASNVVDEDFNSSGDWEIYLLNLPTGIVINLTRSLAGDQIQPSWSKHAASAP